MANTHVDPVDDDGDAAAAGGDTAVGGRVRRSHTRSRTGCLTCRKRHVRCDEGRPHCAKCLSADRECEYPNTFVPLRERRVQGKDKLPGQLQPWSASVISQPSSSSSGASSALVPYQSSSSSSPSIPSHMGPAFIDPFGMLPIKMAFRSKELLHYFHQAGDALKIAPVERKEDCLARATLDPFALRNSLLLAGLHYAWSCQGLRDFESTFLFHKVETIRMVNHAIANQQSRAVNHVACARQIATLCLTEACLGNTPAAEAHLTGLSRYLDFRDSNLGGLAPRDEVEEELLDRYLLMTYSFVHTLKSRTTDFPRKPRPTPEQEREDPEGVRIMMQRWQRQEKAGLAVRLKSLRLFPFFFSQVPSGRKPHDVDVYSILRCLKPTAYFIERKDLDPGMTVFGTKSLDVFDKSEPADLLLHCLETLRRSLSLEPEDTAPRPDGQPKLVSSWCGAVILVAFFFNSVCSIANEGKPIEARLHRRVLTILQQDISSSEAAMRAKPGLHRSLWFWKVFTAALTLDLRLKDPNGDYYTSRTSSESGGGETWLDGEASLDAMRLYYDSCVKTWSDVAGVSMWEHAEETLTQIAWPKIFPNKPVAELLWKRLGGPQNVSSRRQ